MNRRADHRIEMSLRCQIWFPKFWALAVQADTINLHRNGVLLCCEFPWTQETVPALGAQANLVIQLPSEHAFTAKSIECDGTLLRLRHLGGEAWTMALRLKELRFKDWCMTNLPIPSPNCGSSPLTM